MLSSFIGTISGLFDRRFLVTVWFPIFCFCAAWLILLALSIGPDVMIEKWDSWSPILQIWISIGALICITFAAYICDWFSENLIRFYEGHNWPILMQPLYRWGMYRQRRQWLRLQKEMDRIVAGQFNLESRQKTVSAQEQESVRKAIDESDREYDRLFAMAASAFPLNERALMPTRLGNILAAGEEYTRSNYNIEVSVIWPRLVPHLPESLQGDIDQASTPMKAALFLGTLALVFSLVSGVYLLIFGDRPWLFVAVVVGGIWLFDACYRSAIQSAVKYRMLVRVGFDLYRHRLLKTLGIPVPESLIAERSLWPQLANWWHAGVFPRVEDGGRPAWLGKQDESDSPSKPQEHIVHLKLETEVQEEAK